MYTSMHDPLDDLRPENIAGPTAGERFADFLRDVNLALVMKVLVYAPMILVIIALIFYTVQIASQLTP